MFRQIINRNVAQKLCFNCILSQNKGNFTYLNHLKLSSSYNLAKKYDENNLTSTREKLPRYEKRISKNDTITEQELIVRLKNDPDIFGGVTDSEIIDEGDLNEEKHFTEQVSPSKRLRTKQYADIIKNFIRKRKIKEAIDVLEVRMLQHDKVKPENYIYNLVLGACGRVGYTKKAFSLYNKMKQRGLKVTGGTYTALFNACANSPWPEDGLSRAKRLREIMIEKGDDANDTTYNAMIKAFGRCGELPLAFTLVDEMTQKKINIKNGTIDFLLQACITDKEAGFRHALLVWRKLLEKNIKPSIFTYNLMLKCIRECGLGDIETTKDVISRILNSNDLKKLPSKDSHVKTIESSQNVTKKEIETKQYIEEDGEHQDSHETTPVMAGADKLNDVSIEIRNSYIEPNLMSKVPTLGNIITLSEVKNPEDRLLLVGGCKGFLKMMELDKCAPDIKTFTQLLEAIPNTVAAEKELLKSMKNSNLTPDIDFYNMLMKKRSLRFDYDGAKEILEMLKEMGYRPDLITYGILAMGCKNKEEALVLLEEMKEHKYSLNAEILGAMVCQACHQFKFFYVLEMMETCIRENVQPNEKFMQHLVTFRKKCREFLNEKKFTKTQEKQFGIFRARYKTWLQEVQIEDPNNTHPWQQYRQETPEDVKYKSKDVARFKARHRSVFKVQTSTKHKKVKK